MPQEFIYQLRRVIHQMLKRSTTKTEQERLIADILDNLQVNFKLTDKQMLRSYNFHKGQKILQKLLDSE